MYYQGDPDNRFDIRWQTTDTIVQRLAVAPLPAVGSQATIPIEILGLNLVSVQPITVNCPGDDSWEVRVCLSSLAPQPQGSMTIRKVDAQGGTFASTLPILPKLIFKSRTTSVTKVIDFADPAFNLPAITFTGNNGNWVYNPNAALAVVTVPPNLPLDRDCDGTVETVPVGTSNFHAGVISIHPSMDGWGQTPVVYSVTRVPTEGEGLHRPDAGHPPPNDLYELGNGPFSALPRGGELFQSSGALLGAAPDKTNVDRMSASWGVGPAPGGGPPFMGPFFVDGPPQARLAGAPPGTLGLVPSDELDAVSFGRDGGRVLIFSVRDDADGLPGTAVNFHSSLSPGALPLGTNPSNGGGNVPGGGGESGGDLYSSAVFGVFGDLGLQAPANRYNVLGVQEDDLDAVEVSDASVVDSAPLDGIPDYDDPVLGPGTKLVFFSLGPGSPSLAGAVTPDDILKSVPGFIGGFAIYADGVANIGLLPGDNLNSLALWDAGGPAGALGPGDEALFTLSPGSPSLTVGANPNMPPGPLTPGTIFHTAFVPAPGGITVYATAAAIGLDANDVVDALDIGGVWGGGGGGGPDGGKTMTREQALFAAHGVLTPQCLTVQGSQCTNPDSDHDNVPDDADNAPFVSNFLQEDNDLDFVGNVVDNCPNLYNPDQTDTDGDHFGDPCDSLPLVFNPNQAVVLPAISVWGLALLTLLFIATSAVILRHKQRQWTSI
ncbi:MAG: hypothetical protein AUG09_02545 [Acidobacteria bacterium 13_1_20CM_2_68_7]|nr:MAG: hypothetical protein AUG09_02545 [Acidobacteria bacterium 13_1_20CM_2_68_7]